MKAEVFFIGGYNATQLDINAWLRSAKLQRPDVAFNGYPWPRGANSDADSAVKAFTRSGQMQSVIDDIQTSDGKVVYIVGHSSGCAIANAVDANLEYTGHMTLVSLDGFRPNADQLERDTTQVWGAACGDVTSRNYPGPSNGRRRIYCATNCYTMWALHFSLVNAAATDKIVQDISTGYAQCKANLGFLQ